MIVAAHQGGSTLAEASSTGDEERYRLNACAVIVRRSDLSDVLLCRRSEHASLSHPWQFPQGGIEAHETPAEAVIREVFEETGLKHLRILKALEAPLRYRFPQELLRATTDASPAPLLEGTACERDASQRGVPRQSAPQEDVMRARYVGQAQHWFLLSLEDETQSPDFTHQLPPEFDAYCWAKPGDVLPQVVCFKRRVYRKGLEGLGLLHPRAD